MSDLKLSLADLEKCNAVVALLATPGWKVLNEHFKQVLDSVIQKILIAQDSFDVVRLQERYHAFKSMLDTVELMAQMRDAKSIEVDEMQADQRFKDQYGIKS